MSHAVDDRGDEHSPAAMDVSPDGHEHVSMFGKVKNKAKKLRDRVKAQYDSRNDDKEEEGEEEEEEEDVDQHSQKKPDENVEGVTNAMAGLGGLGTAKKEDRSKEEPENVKKNTLGDILGKNDAMLTEETRKPSERPDELRHNDGMLTEAKENPKEDLSYFKETEQGGDKRGDSFLTTEKEKNETDVGTPSFPQKAGVAMAGATGGILGLGKVNKQEEGGEEKPYTSKFDTPPKFENPPIGLKEVPIGLKEVPKPLEEEFQNLLGKPKDQQSDIGEGNELSPNEKETGEDKFGASVVTKKPSGLLQGLKNSLTSDQGKKAAIVPEEQSREDQDTAKQSEGEDKGGQGYAQKLFAAKNVISSKFGYGGQPNDQRRDVVEGNELSSNEKQTGEAESGASVDAKKPSGLFQGLRDSLTSDQGKKDAIVPEEQSRENQEGENKGGQGYAQKLFAAKNVISSKLGYGGQPDDQQRDVGEENELSSDEKPTGEAESGAFVDTKKPSGLVQGLKDSYEGKKDAIVPEEQSKENQHTGKQSEGEGKEGQGYAQKLFAAKNVVSSKLGYGGQESKGEEKDRAAVDESKEEKQQGPKTEGGTENKETFKNTIVSKLSPGEDDKALSEVITETFNNTAKSIFGGFYGGTPKDEVPPKEVVPPSPSSGKEGTAELPHNNNPENSSASKGIVGRVTGVMSSFMGKKPKEGVDNLSPHTQDPIHGEFKEEPTGVPETQTGNRIEGATK